MLADADKPLVDSFAKAAHALDIKQESFNALVDWYYGVQDQQLAARQEVDANFHDSSLAELAQEWGTETKANQRAIANLLEMAPGGMADPGGQNPAGGIGYQIAMSRLPNGNRLGDDPGALRFLVQLGREINPESTIVPPGTQNAGAHVASRLAEIEKMMGDPGSGYWRGPGAAAMQQEYRELFDAQDKMKRRSA